jgi:hypothetical protein
MAHRRVRQAACGAFRDGLRQHGWVDVLARADRVIE